MAKAIKTTKEGKKMGLSNTMISWIYRSLFFLFTLLFLGVYNACSSFTEALTIGSALINNGLNKIVCATSSHFSSAECYVPIY